MSSLTLDAGLIPLPRRSAVPSDTTADTAAETLAETLKGLVLRARDGDAEAFGSLYDHYVELVYRYVYYRVGSHALTEDLTSETFLRALRRIRDFHWQGKDFGAWLVTIARNLVADHFKSGRYRLEVCTAELMEPDRPQEGPERAVLDSMTNRTLLTAVRRLGSEQQECVVLRFLHGLSVAETALIMGKKSGAIKALQYRAVRSLARMLPDDPR
ncbi:sigma-70 family RNA polymerase sigma factor [Actinomadura sp. WMMB 499]|uniref:sigma-70 family RNA polymerase sigma factor n=1 Tax=Actinomadura sp. WMMB 499 TaxID=1219491 RepID=UPI00124556C9|nr:sigma-70 family RNA polymerase sigma factor [Actinomadura sp. WMMB 499]QFG23770.1 sigma-70 family RNA polymerase sigma factor [Actinomadura sp. WMMB 499]